MANDWDGSPEVVKFAFKPTLNTEKAARGCVSAVVDKVVSCLSQSFTESFTYLSRYSVLSINGPRCFSSSCGIHY